MPSTRSSTTTDDKENVDNVEKDKKVAKKLKYENSWVFLSKDNVFDNSSTPSIVTLKHPRYEKTSKFLIERTKNKIYEIQTYKEPYRSWLIGETVKSDGSIYITTPIDPLFLILPYLKSQCTTRAIPLEQLLSSSTDDDLKELVELNIDLSNIGDLKGPADLSAYKYNEEKTLKWLEEKVRKVSKVVKAERLHVKQGAVSATFMPSSLKTEDNDDEELYLKYSHGIVSEYLSEDLGQSLYERFKFKAEIIPTIGNKRKSQADSNDNVTLKKVKVEKCKDAEMDTADGEDKKKAVEEKKSEYFANSAQVKAVKPVVLSAKDKQMQKAASGSKSITSFFTKK